MDIKQSIIEDLTRVYENDPDFDINVLTIKVDNAIREVKRRRNYKATRMTDKDILEDLEDYYDVIYSVAEYDYNKRGAEGENQHSEDGTVRVWTNRDELFKGVHAFVKVL